MTNHYYHYTLAVYNKTFKPSFTGGNKKVTVYSISYITVYIKAPNP